LVADVGVAAFRAAFVMWLASEDRDFGVLVVECFRELVRLVAQDQELDLGSAG
jgi:hypothetical protein